MVTVWVISPAVALDTRVVARVARPTTPAGRISRARVVLCTPVGATLIPSAACTVGWSTAPPRRARAAAGALTVSSSSVVRLSR